MIFYIKQDIIVSKCIFIVEKVFRYSFEKIFLHLQSSIDLSALFTWLNLAEKYCFR